MEERFCEREGDWEWADVVVQTRVVIMVVTVCPRHSHHDVVYPSVQPRLFDWFGGGIARSVVHRCDGKVLVLIGVDHVGQISNFDLK